MEIMLLTVFRHKIRMLNCSLSREFSSDIQKQCSKIKLQDRKNIDEISENCILT